MRLLLLTAMILASFMAAPSQAQDRDQLDSLRQAEEQARAEEARLRTERQAVSAEIEALKAELARDTQQTQAFERENKRLSDRLDETEARLAVLETELADTRSETQILLASLQRLQLAPNAAAIADPDDAVRTAQAATMIDLLSDALRQRAEQTIDLAARTSAVRDETLTQKEALEANNTELIRRKARTQALVAEKERLQASIRTDEEKARAEALRLAAEAESLEELLDRVQDIPDTLAPRIKPGRPPVSGPVTLPPGTVRFAEAQGGVVRPVAGTLTQGFGRGTKGQTYSARPEGQVIAPYSGRVEFAGPFRNYERVVILNLSDGYYLLLTGLGATYVSANETVQRGEPVGRMPSGSGRIPLYVELRRNGRSIDPEPWMGARR
ncbi:MAG: peptidoglycan DD-metalloendopeptidase family protein [Litorimonas sp.]